MSTSEPEQRLTTDAWEQRAGTWTGYHHVERFLERHPGWLIVGVQSNGWIRSVFIFAVPDRTNSQTDCA